MKAVLRVVAADNAKTLHYHATFPVIPAVRSDK